MQTFQTSDGLKLAYEDNGEGPVLLCLAGLSRNRRDFDDLAASITGVRLISMDYRGRGQSQFDADPMNYQIPIEARDALELLDHLGIESAAIIGSSRGGIIAMFLAAVAKHRLNGIVLNDVGAELDRADIGRIVDYVGVKPTFTDFDEALAQFPELNPGFIGVSQDRWKSVLHRMFQQTDDGLATRYDPELQQSVRAAYEGPEPDLWPLFDACAGLPLALLRGENSQLLTRETVTRMQARRPDMLFSEVSDRGHIPFLDEPESLRIINQFIEKIT
ncbi:MAG: pimeloyl-ACP methyl ester carboxylesterase [Paracoccaceae bacterium]|jgi:pimeloyl-ACP methyl ester carboxylesterase